MAAEEIVRRDLVPASNGRLGQIDVEFCGDHFSLHRIWYVPLPALLSTGENGTRSRCSQINDGQVMTMRCQSGWAGNVH